MRTLHFALIAAISFFALVCAPPDAAAQTAAEQTLSRTFNILRSVGEASNTGRGEDEALRQACVALQEQGTLALNEGLDKLFYDRLTSSTASLFDFSSLISSQSKSGLSQALSAGCAALTSVNKRGILTPVLG